MPTDEEFYRDAAKTKVNLEFLKQHLTAEGRLTEDQALFLVESATNILKNEGTLIDVEAPLTGAETPAGAAARAERRRRLTRDTPPHAALAWRGSGGRSMRRRSWPVLRPHEAV